MWRPTVVEIRAWLRQAVTEGATHCLIVCDTFDREDYPVAVERTENVREVYEKYNGKEMQKVLEVYNLSLPLEPQIAEHRAMNF